MHAATTLLVDGEASALVAPDRFVATAALASPVAADAAAALADVAARRRTLLDALAAAHPQAELADAAVRVREHLVEVVEGGRTDLRAEGVVGECEVTATVPAADAAALVATLGAALGDGRLAHRFEVGPALARSTRLALQEEAIRDARARAVGLAAAADLVVDGIVSIGERADGGGSSGAFAMPLMAKSARGADALEVALGELRPEPELRSEVVPVRFRLR